MSKNIPKIFLLKILLILISIILIIFLLYLFVFPKIVFTGEAISWLNKNPLQVKVLAITENNSNITIEITNSDKKTYYIEEIAIKNCDEFTEIIPIDPKKTKTIEIPCLNTLDKKIKIFYKKQGSPNVLEYNSIIK